MLKSTKESVEVEEPSQRHPQEERTSTKESVEVEEPVQKNPVSGILKKSGALANSVVILQGCVARYCCVYVCARTCVALSV